MGSTLKELITSFTKSVDLYNYLLKNHHRRTAIASYLIGMEYGLDEESLSDLVIAAALHDVGALSVAERDQLIQMDIENPYPHSRLGCYMLESFAPFLKISRIVYYHHWRYEDDDNWVREFGEVPIQSYILHVADRIDILIHHEMSVLMQKGEVTKKIISYEGTLFHPEVINAFKRLAGKDSFWLNIDNLDMETVLENGITKKFDVSMTLEMLEQIAFTLSKIIDSRSQFATAHSYGVSKLAYAIAGFMGYSDEKCRKIQIAGLLHDMGKIAISTELIEKKGELLVSERADLRAHAYFTSLILNHIEGLGEIADWAVGHHENHDGSGYPRNLTKEKITEEMDIIAYADIYTAFSEERPYRSGLPAEEILTIIENKFKEKHGGKVFQVLQKNLFEVDRVCKDAVRDGIERFRSYEKMSYR